MLSSYSDVFGIDHNHDTPEDVQAGDLVRTGANHFPHFEVLAIHGEKAWLRNVETGVDGVALLRRCRKIYASTLLAAE